jgi:hypothetical protein
MERTEDPDMNPHSYANLIFDKDAQNIQWTKDSLFNKCCWENWISACRKQKPDPCVSPYTNINSKWIKDLNIRPETLKQLWKVVGNAVEHNRHRELPKQNTRQIKEKMNKWNSIKLKSCCTANETVTRLKKLLTEWEKILARYLLDKGLISRIYRELKKLNPKESTPQ